jgi:phage tail tape-measure protein
MDASLRAIVDAATRASGGSVTVVVAGTGSASAANTGTGSTDPSQLISTVEQHVKGTQPVVQAAVAGGLFLDRQTLASEGISSQTVVQALLGLKAPQGGPLLADAFPGFAISFAKYC